MIKRLIRPYKNLIFLNSVFHKIQELKTLPRLSKHEQLVNGIIQAIDEKILVKGSMLPSVNVMVNELGFARKTIVKAYTDLKDRGLVESKNRLGYFVANDSTKQTKKVALVLFAFHSFQERFYNAFRKSLGVNIQLDIFFHHNNSDVLESIMSNIAGQYGNYIVAPIPGKKTKELLKEVPANKLLVVDRHMEIGTEYSFVAQKFREPMYQTLITLKERLGEFNKFVLFFKEKTDYPRGIFRAFRDFMEEHGMKHEIIGSYEPGMLEKGTVYFTINDNDLWEIIKDCKQQGMELGKDIGVLSHNESTIKEIIHGGITTFSTDFKEMARRAAAYVKNQKTIKEIIPSVLIRRSSL